MYNLPYGSKYLLRKCLGYNLLWFGGLSTFSDSVWIHRAYISLNYIKHVQIHHQSSQHLPWPAYGLFINLKNRPLWWRPGARLKHLKSENKPTAIRWFKTDHQFHTWDSQKLGALCHHVHTWNGHKVESITGPSLIPTSLHLSKRRSSTSTSMRVACWENHQIFRPGYISHDMGGFSQIWGPQVTMGFNTKLWQFMTWMIWGTAILGNSHMFLFLVFHYTYIPTGPWEKYVRKLQD